MVFMSHSATSDLPFSEALMTNCLKCGGNLLPVNLLEDQPAAYRHYSNAKLIGFTDPNGWRCENSKSCTAHYAVVDEKLKLLHSEHRYEPLPNSNSDLPWQIIDEWNAELLDLSKLEAEHKAAMADLDDYINDPFTGNTRERTATERIIDEGIEADEVRADGRQRWIESYEELEDGLSDSGNGYDDKDNPPPPRIRLND
jgi:hypothetical protein